MLFRSVRGSEAGLIARKQQDARGRGPIRAGRIAVQRAQAGVDGTGDALLPIAIEYDRGIVERNRRADNLKMRAKYSDYGRSAGLVREANSAFQQCFAAVLEQLFRLAQAAAGSGGKYDRGEGHRHQSTLGILTGERLSRKTGATGTKNKERKADR